MFPVSFDSLDSHHEYVILRGKCDLIISAVAMTFVGMLLRKVDPFAVYAAERELAQRGISVQRDLLISSYLVNGQLQTFVAKLIAEPEDITAAFAKSMMDGPGGFRKQQSVSLLVRGLLFSIAMIGALAAFGGLHALRFGMSLNRALSFWAIVVAGCVILLCITYAVLRSRLGRETANRIIGFVIAFGLYAFCFFWIKRL